MPVVATPFTPPLIVTFIHLAPPVLPGGAGTAAAKPSIPDTAAVAVAATAAIIFIIIVPASAAVAQVTRRLAPVRGQPLTINDTQSVVELLRAARTRKHPLHRLDVREIFI
jgi:hypothetical protein